MRNAVVECVLGALVLSLSAGAPAGSVSESWGAGPRRVAVPLGATVEAPPTHAPTVKVVTTGKVPRVVFDLAAIPRGTAVHHASLYVSARQPREPIRMVRTDKLDADGRPVGASAPLKLEAPRYISFDATEAVRAWVNDPASNLGLAAESFEGALRDAVLVVRYEGKADASKLPPQVGGLRVTHRDGQTFLVWTEVPAFRPPAKAILWITHMSSRGIQTAPEPGKGIGDSPRPAAITLQTLRDMQGLAVRDKPIGHWARAMPPFKRVREVPVVSYRVYRHDQKITAETFKDAKLLGEVPALCAYQSGFINIKSHGEYYGPHEDATSIIPTFSVGPDDPVRPGEAYYVHTPTAAGKAFYAVTAVSNGTENVAAITDANSSPAMDEKPATPKPVLQFVTVNKTRYGNSTATEYWYGYWLSPPLANVPDNRPRRVVMAIPKDFKEPGPMVLGTHAGMGRGWKVDHIDKAHLHIEQDVAYGGDLCYHSGRGTLLSFREGRVDYYSDRYVTKTVLWALSKWKIDGSRITASVGSHYGIRQPELLPIMWMAPYAVDYDQKWNPCRGSLDGRLGPVELAKTVDGHPAWDVCNIAWYLRQDPGKDIPFWVHDVNGKETGHNVEYGWQDDAKGLSALRDTRQPFVARWGGAVSREIIDGLRKMKWTRSVPAFSNCSLDGNPGNGDPADGDPWGQINGFLFWDFDSIVDQKDRWEMTVYLTADSVDDACTVDLTPRHLKRFAPKAGETFKWANTSVADKKLVASGTAKADRWSLVTLRQIAVTKGRNRITIAR